MVLKVIGAGCPDCGKMYTNTLEAVERLGIQATVEKVDNLVDIVRLGVMTAPSLLKDGELIVSGQVASVDKIMKLLQK